jgi:hypothetical protein
VPRVLPGKKMARVYWEGQRPLGNGWWYAVYDFKNEDIVAFVSSGHEHAAKAIAKELMGIPRLRWGGAGAERWVAPSVDIPFVISLRSPWFDLVVRNEYGTTYTVAIVEGEERARKLLEGDDRTGVIGDPSRGS